MPAMSPVQTMSLRSPTVAKISYVTCPAATIWFCSQTRRLQCPDRDGYYAHTHIQTQACTTHLHPFGFFLQLGLPLLLHALLLIRRSTLSSRGSLWWPAGVHTSDAAGVHTPDAAPSAAGAPCGGLQVCTHPGRSVTVSCDTHPGRAVTVTCNSLYTRAKKWQDLLPCVHVHAFQKGIQHTCKQVNTKALLCSNVKGACGIVILVALNRMLLISHYWQITVHKFFTLTHATRVMCLFCDKLACCTSPNLHLRCLCHIATLNIVAHVTCSSITALILVLNLYIVINIVSKKEAYGRSADGPRQQCGCKLAVILGCALDHHHNPRKC